MNSAKIVPSRVSAAEKPSTLPSSSHSQMPGFSMNQVIMSCGHATAVAQDVLLDREADLADAVAIGFGRASDEAGHGRRMCLENSADEQALGLRCEFAKLSDNLQAR